MAASATLLRDWDLLQSHVVPVLLGIAPERAPEAWTLGPAQDAVAVALAYDHMGGPDTAEIFVYLSSHPDSGPVEFALSDLQWVPRGASLHFDHPWAPPERLTRRVMLEVPRQAVDLVTIRAVSLSSPHPGSGESRPALGALRRAGRVLFVGGPAPSGFGRDGTYRPLDDAGRVFEKLSPTVVAPPPSDQPVATLATKVRHHALVASHVNLARSLARRFAHHGELADDLEQVALLALVKAAGRFSPDHGTTFATFATASILGEIKRHFRDRTWMLRVPRSLQETYLAVKATREVLIQELGASPTVPQIARRLGIPDENVLAAMEAADSYWPTSLDAPLPGSEDARIEVPVVDDGFDGSLDRAGLQEQLPRLRIEERLVVKRLFFDGWTQRQVAEELDVSQMQVSRLLARTLAKLRVALSESG